MDTEMNDLFRFNGDEQNLKMALKDYLEEQDIDKFIKFISNHPFNNGTDYIQTEISFPSPPPGMMSFMVAQNKYNINLTKSTFLILSVIADIKIKIPIASTVMSMAGINTNTITKIDERKGEKCIVFEVMKNGKQHFNIDEFDNKGECINNNFTLCQFRSSGLCSICKEDIKKILDSLVKRNVIKEKMGSYKYII